MGNLNLAAYNISVEGEAGMILAHFNKDYILNIIQDNLQQRGLSYEISSPNIVSALEQQFKLVSSGYPAEAESIAAKRSELYRDIIDILCRTHGLELNIKNDQDEYSVAYFLYDLLIANFKTNFLNFFTQYIYREKNNLYLSLNLNDLKKSKDSSTIYGKKMYQNPKLAIINANLELVLDSIITLDIPFEDMMNTIYIDKNVAKNYIDMVSCVLPFYTTVYVPFLQHHLTRASMISDIRLSIHALATDSSAGQ